MIIAVSGIGGLGGYFGGLLAKYYENNPDVRIIFLSRGQNLNAIQKNGLQVLSTKENFTAFPYITTSDASLIGKVDVLVCCTKRYNLAENLIDCHPCISSETIILPLLNGVDNRQFISRIYPSNLVLDGCVYLVARLTEPGIIMETGNIEKLFFGTDHNEDSRLLQLLTIFKNSGIEATLSDNIKQVIWEKFSFISPIATLTSYLDCTIGEIVASEPKKELLKSLLSELTSVANKLSIYLPARLYQNTIDKMAVLPKESTSSMHSDYRKRKSTELDSLTGYIYKEASIHQVDVPLYEKMYEILRDYKSKDHDY